MSAIVEPGDFVRDRMDDGSIRKVEAIWETTVHLEDGGTMDLNEIQDGDVVLESEAYEESLQDSWRTRMEQA